VKERCAKRGNRCIGVSRAGRSQRVIQPRSRAVVTATASSRMAPFTQPCQKADTWLRVSPSATTPRKSTPIAVPKTPPSPPLNAVPPIRTAAITVMI